MQRFVELLRRGWRKPPDVIARWLVRQAKGEIDQRRAPARARRLTLGRLLAATRAADLDQLWRRIGEVPFPTFLGPLAAADYDRLCPGDRARILAAAEAALDRRVDLLGSGPVELGRPIDWLKDFKSGHAWPNAPFRRIDVLDLDRPSDVKVPWELSRLQWLIPAGQAFALSADDRYALAVRQVIAEWDDANPLAQGVNWACTMDVALRGISLAWLSRTFHAAPSWRDDDFRFRVLRLLYLTGDFTRRHLEWSDVNGNHLTADAAGLVVMGAFFGQGRGPEDWQQTGWKILTDELPRQVFADGVDFEASTAYHRLALELFLLPALYRQALGQDVPTTYADRLRRMARFVAAYTRPDGKSPLWGDSDDGRALPFGPHPVNDHRYLIANVGLAFGDAELVGMASGPAAETLWTLGPEAAAKIPGATKYPSSQAFVEAGVYVMREGLNHVFIDCGPVGMAGRGAHGHNDCLSLEAAVLGRLLLTDCGAYVYSADQEWRNSFRSTAFHNTPVVDDKEQNRFVRPEYLWSLHDDAKPEVRLWRVGPDADWFVGAHAGYRRLSQPVTPVRVVTLDKENHRLAVIDRFEGAGGHVVRVPYHLAPGVMPVEEAPGRWRLETDAGDFVLVFFDGAEWTAAVGDGWVSPRYGVKERALVLNFMRDGALAPLAVGLMPATNVPADAARWLAEQAARAESLAVKTAV